MRYISIILIAFLSLIILRINIKLHSENYTTTEKRHDIVLQLNFLEQELKNKNLGVRMQELFPEGFVFVNALYGLTWCELALSDQSNQELKVRAIEEAIYAFNNINSESAKWNFPNYVKPDYGIFYNGWRNYLLSKILMVDTTFKGSKDYILKFQYYSSLIIDAIEKSNTPYLESYERYSWPADMFVAMASISNHDKIFKPMYQKVIDKWISKVEDRFDPETGIIPHEVDFSNGKTIQGARGCSIGLILRMLGEIDKKLAIEQFALMEENFITKTFGLPTVREFPIGQHGSGDIDSGPVVFGVGFSATIVMLGTLSMYDNLELAEKQYKTIHALGFGKKTKKQKKYLYGKLPMADAFIAWGRATTLNYSHEDFTPKHEPWRFKFHLISILILLAFWMFYFRKQLYLSIKQILISRQ